jgi:hypothetical protein
MLHACVERFDVIGVRGNILGWDGEVNKALAPIIVADLELDFLFHFFGDVRIVAAQPR